MLVVLDAASLGIYKGITHITTRTLDVMPVGNQDILQESANSRETNGGVWTKPQVLPSRSPTINPSDITAVTVAAVKSEAMIIKGRLGGVAVELC